MGNQFTVKTKDYEGIICICDALGIRHQSLRDSKITLSKLGAVIRETTKDSLAQHVLGKKGLPKPRFFTFGDTVLSAWEIPKGETARYLSTFSHWATQFIEASLRQEIAFRGAFSLGEYVMNPKHNLVIGPAVSDAADWYEQGRVIGISCTPSTMLKFEKLVVSDDLKPHQPNRISHFLRYPVQTKIGEKEFWCVDWPNAILHPQQPKRRRIEILEMLSKFRFPLGTEDILENTMEFVDYCLRHGQERPPKSPEGAL